MKFMISIAIVFCGVILPTLCAGAPCYWAFAQGSTTTSCCVDATVVQNEDSALDPCGCRRKVEMDFTCCDPSGCCFTWTNNTVCVWAASLTFNIDSECPGAVTNWMIQDRAGCTVYTFSGICEGCH